MAFNLSRILQVIRTNHHLAELVAELKEVRAIVAPAFDWTARSKIDYCPVEANSLLRAKRGGDH
jgi:hypothetical protein